jgi:hypothetical protein
MFDLEATVVDSWHSACPLMKKIEFAAYVKKVAEKNPSRYGDAAKIWINGV